MDTDLDKTKDKDAELARWREQALQEDATANALRDQVASLTSLVEELADALEMEIVCHEDCATRKVCAGVKRCDSREYRALVAKAREVCK